MKATEDQASRPVTAVTGVQLHAGNEMECWEITVEVIPTYRKYHSTPDPQRIPDDIRRALAAWAAGEEAGS